MDRPRRRLSELSAKELSQRAIQYRRMALTAHGESAIKSLNILAIRYAMLAAKREVELSTNSSSDPAKSEVEKLARLAEQAVATQPDPIRELADAIRIVADSEADPYLLMGVLLEGAVHTLRGRIPLERQINAAAALLKLMADRLSDAGVPPRSG